MAARVCGAANTEVVGPAVAAGVPARQRSFGQPRRASSLNAAADGGDAGLCATADPSGARTPVDAQQCGADAALGYGLGTLATASLALMRPLAQQHGGGGPSPPVGGSPTAAAAAGAPVAVGGRRVTEAPHQPQHHQHHQHHPQTTGRGPPRPAVAMRRLPAGKVTKHPGVKNALKARPRPSALAPRRLAPACLRLSAPAAAAQVTLFDW